MSLKWHSNIHRLPRVRNILFWRHKSGIILWRVRFWEFWKLLIALYGDEGWFSGFLILARPCWLCLDYKCLVSTLWGATSGNNIILCKVINISLKFWQCFFSELMLSLLYTFWNVIHLSLKNQCRKYSSHKRVNLQTFTMKWKSFTCLSTNTTRCIFVIISFYVTS